MKELLNKIWVWFGSFSSEETFPGEAPRMIARTPTNNTAASPNQVARMPVSQDTPRAVAITPGKSTAPPSREPEVLRRGNGHLDISKLFFLEYIENGYYSGTRPISKDVKASGNVYHGFRRGFFIRDVEKGKSLVLNQKQALPQIRARWEAFLVLFKQKCKDFSSRINKEFESILVQILSNENFSFPRYEDLFEDHWSMDQNRESRNQAYATCLWLFPVNFTALDSLKKKLLILQEGEAWIQRFLSAVHDAYQHIPRSKNEGVFVKIECQDEIYKFLRYVNQKFSPHYFHLSNLQLLLSRNNPFLPLAAGEQSFSLPSGPRKAHMWVCAASESGKTQLIQRMICDDIEHGIEQGKSVVVVDSQRDMIMDKLLWLKHDMEIVLIDPEDIEYPPGIALFDIPFGTGREAEDREADVIQCYGDMFSVFGAELTGRQDSLLAPALRLMFTIPNANIFTLIDLFRGENMSRYIANLPEAEQKFFNKDWVSPQYKANKQQILAKLNIIVQNKTIRRIFANTKRKFDFYSILNRPCVVLINTSRSLLKDKGCMLFGRFMLSQIIDAIRQRANIPEVERRTTYIYVDEGKDYRDADAIINTVYECRKYGGHLIFCSQNYSQLGSNMASALFSSAIKVVRAVRETSETNKLAESIRIDKEEFRNLKYVDHKYSEWACQIRDEKAIKLRVDFGYLENRPKITEAEYQKLRKENRRKYCVKAGEAERRSSGDGGRSDERRDTPPDDDDDYFV